MVLKPVGHRSAVALTDGREVAPFTGAGAKWRAIRYIGRGFTHAG